MKLKELILISIGALSFLLITGIAKADGFFMSTKIEQEFNSLPLDHKKSTCGLNDYNKGPDIDYAWEVINQDLAYEIKGYNSRMDNKEEVLGSHSEDVFNDYSNLLLYAYVTQDKKLKEQLFSKLHTWAEAKALTGTTTCYNRNPNDKVRAHCENEWSDPDGQDLAPIKDSYQSLVIVFGLNYSYDVVFRDFKPNDPRHEVIKKWFKGFYKKIPPSIDFYWGNQMAWFLPNTFARYQKGQKYEGSIKSMIKKADRHILKDGSMKDRTTRGNNALWYHHTAIGEAFTVLEMAYAADIELPKNYEKELLLAVELFHNAMLDNSYITPWAKKGLRGQFNKDRPDYQNFPLSLDHITYGGTWMFQMQYRYPNHPTSVWLSESLSYFAESLRTDVSVGFPMGCIYAAIANK